MRKRHRILKHDHHYEDSPSALRQKLNEARKTIKKNMKTIKLQKRIMQRLQTQLLSFKEIIFEIRRDRKVFDNCLNSLESINDDGVKEFLQRVFENGESVSISRNQYPPGLRRFALTLHFYSPKAYMYVRDKMNKVLPHPSVVRA